MKGKILVYNIKNRALPLKDWVYYKYMIFRSDAKSKNIRIVQDLNMVHFYEGGGGREKGKEFSKEEQDIAKMNVKNRNRWKPW